MADRNGKSEYDDVLDQARDLIRDADSAGEEFSLEEILAEYGGGTDSVLSCTAKKKIKDQSNFVHLLKTRWLSFV